MKPADRLETLSRSQQRLYTLCEDLVSRGTWPGPVILNELLHNHSSRNLNGREVRARTAFFEDHGFKHEAVGSRWYLPTKRIWKTGRGGSAYR